MVPFDQSSLNHQLLVEVLHFSFGSFAKDRLGVLNTDLRKHTHTSVCGVAPSLLSYLLDN